MDVDLAGADRIMNESVFIGTYPGLTPAMLEYMVETITRFAQTATPWRKEKNMIVLKLWSDQHSRTPIDVFVYEPFDFAREYARAQWESVAGRTKAPIVAYKTLLAMKRRAGREKDLLDIKALKKLDPYR